VQEHVASRFQGFFLPMDWLSEIWWA
jgi:hypothetical protein